MEFGPAVWSRRGTCAFRHLGGPKLLLNAIRTKSEFQKIRACFLRLAESALQAKHDPSHRFCLYSTGVVYTAQVLFIQHRCCLYNTGVVYTAQVLLIQHKCCLYSTSVVYTALVW
jgi:hypothetical protein